jgi:hypothetical protein
VQQTGGANRAGPGLFAEGIERDDFGVLGGCLLLFGGGLFLALGGLLLVQRVLFLLLGLLLLEAQAELDRRIDEGADGIVGDIKRLRS